MLGPFNNLTVRVLSRATPTVTRDIRFLWSSLRTRNIHAYFRALTNGAGKTCFKDLSLLWLELEIAKFRKRGVRSNRLRHCRGLFSLC